ncbi:MAG: HD domain-containing protein [Candidatus Liptonbacteria bacterium]|nr:HD domain-containing protein [Candidatus Liptonbacteria bacterium]
MPTREEKVLAFAKPYFESGRVGDWDHAHRVARWVRELAANRKDKEVLTVAAYLHDVGWYGVAPRGKLNFGEMLKLEATASQNTAPLIEKIMRLAGYGKNNIDTVIRLAEAVNRHASKSEDEAVLLDADNLSKLSPQHLEEKYDKGSWKEVIESWEKEFPSQIKTLRAKELYPSMLADLRKKYLESGN